MPTIKFIKEKKEIEVPVGANLRRAALESGVSVYHGINGIGAGLNRIFNCHGLGMCGTCMVSITKGMENTNKMGIRERLKFKGLPFPDLTALHYIGHESTARLSCLTQVHGDIEVTTGPEFNLFGDNFFS